MKGRPMSDSALILLEYVAEHPSEPQSTRRLSEATGVPDRTVSALLGEYRHVLDRTAYEHGFQYRIRSALHDRTPVPRTLLEAVRDSNMRVEELRICS